MTIYEMVRMNRLLLEVLDSNGMNVKDVKYLPMYEEYRRMVREGHKMIYIVAFLSEEYGLSEATIYRVVAKMKKEAVI